MKQHLLALFAGDESRAKQHRIDVWGDYAGNQRTTNSTYQNWGIIKESFEMWNATFHLRPNPHIIDRVNSINGRMRSADGGVHFAVSERCKLLIADFTNLTMPEVMKEKEVEQSRSHASDSCGYWVNGVMGGMTMVIGGDAIAYRS
jgi:hypothetical protein